MVVYFYVVKQLFFQSYKYTKIQEANQPGWQQNSK